MRRVLVRTLMEASVLVLVVLSPWAFGAVDPFFEFLLYCGVAGLLVLWAVRMLLDGRVTWRNCPVALCLSGLFLFGVWQNDAAAARRPGRDCAWNESITGAVAAGAARKLARNGEHRAGAMQRVSASVFIPAAPCAN